MFPGCFEISVLLLNMCDTLKLSGLFVYLKGLNNFSVPGGTEKVAGLWFARGRSVPRLTVYILD